jgi:hypothetical protein
MAAAEAALLAGDFAALGRDERDARSDWTWAEGVLTRAAPSLAGADRTPVLLQQAIYRLSSLHPPGAPLASSGTDPVRPQPWGPKSLVDYRW